MNPKLTQELLDALHASRDELVITDPKTNQCVLVDHESLLRARAALERQQQEDLSAIQQGINDAGAGRIVPAKDSHLNIRHKLVSRFGE